MPHSLSCILTGFRIGEATADVCSSIVEIDNLKIKRIEFYILSRIIILRSYGSLSSVRLRRIQSCNVRRRSLSI